VFGIGMSEMLIILAVALLVFGPQKLPEIAKSIAKGLKELRRAGDDLRSSVNFDLDDDKPAARRPLASPPGGPRPTTEPATPATASSPTEPAAAIAGSELAGDGPRLADVWPKPAEGALPRGDGLETGADAADGADDGASASSDGASAGSVDQTKVH
jgi:TatA/E family protein of Tat protein translocase